MTMLITISIFLVMVISLPLWCPICAWNLVMWLDDMIAELERKMQQDEDE